MVKVTTTPKRKAVKINVQVSNTGQITGSRPIAVQTLPIITNLAAGRLDLLADVDALAEVEGGVPRYHAANDEYVVEKLDFDDLSGDIDEIDGGSF